MPGIKRLTSLPSRPAWRLFLCLVLFVMGWRSGDLRAGEFEDANQLYDQGKYAEAKAGYEKLIESGQLGANLYYDLGNAEFRLGSAGHAILDYERALVLNPRHPEARANLKLLRDKNGAKLLPVAWNEQIAASLAPEAWAIVAAVSGWLNLFLLVLILTSRRRENSWRWALLVFSAMVGSAAGIALASIARDQDRGVILAKQTEARLAPAESAGVAEALTAGSQVRVLSIRGPWVYCELPGAGRGWVPDDAVARVRPGRS